MSDKKELAAGALMQYLGGIGLGIFVFLMGALVGEHATSPYRMGLDCASAVIQHGEVRCIAFVDRTYKP